MEKVYSLPDSTGGIEINLEFKYVPEIKKKKKLFIGVFWQDNLSSAVYSCY